MIRMMLSSETRGEISHNFQTARAQAEYFARRGGWVSNPRPQNKDQ
jgi:hypothetical protein